MIGPPTDLSMGSTLRRRSALGAARSYLDAPTGEPEAECVERPCGPAGRPMGAPRLGTSVRELAGVEGGAMAGPPWDAGAAPHTFQRPRRARHDLGLAPKPPGARTLLDEVVALIDQAGGARWAQMMDALNQAMADWRSVRDDACGAGDYGYPAAMRVQGGCPRVQGQDLADHADERLDRVMAVRDGLAELYRRYDTFGLPGLEPGGALAGPSATGGSGQARGRSMGIVPMAVAAIVASIAGVIGGASVFVWALAERQSAANRASALALAGPACDRDPSSAMCIEALRAGTEPPPSGGPPWGLLAAAAVAAVAVNAFLRRRP